MTKLRSKSATEYAQLAVTALQIARVSEIMRDFKKVGISPLLLKGIALVERIYPAAEQRPMQDIDLLVRQADFRLVVDFLQARGYQFSNKANLWNQDFAQEFMGNMAYRKEGVTFDVHWHPVTMSWFRPTTAFDLEGIWSRAVPMQVGDAPALRLCPEDEVIHLCYHTAVHHGLAHRQGYEDIVRVARAEASNLDWDVLAQRARAWKVSVAVWAALRAACAFDEAAVPERALQALRVPRWRQRILRPYVQQAVDGRAALVSGSMRFLGVVLIDRLRDLPCVLWRGLFPGRRWIQTRFDLTGGQARWRQITYPLEIVWRGLRALF